MTVGTGNIGDNLNRVRDVIAAACSRVHRDPADVTLVAVSKLRSPADILAAAEAGVQHFGENRVEEAYAKLPSVKAQTQLQLTWHMVGHIQSRKARDVAPLFDVVHSVDRVKLAEKLAQAVVESSHDMMDVLLQMNVSGEVSKSGFEATGWQTHQAVREQLWQDVDYVAKLPGLRVRGLMTMAPIVADPEETRPIFAGLMALRDALSEDFDLPLPELSMGMTDDYPVAIEEGATMVRIGRAIFGERD